jgi:uncharacterized protein (DUF983 family)
MGKLVRCRMCSATYERSIFQGFARERSSFDCYGCGTELERWNTNLVPTYSIVVLPWTGHQIATALIGPGTPG